MAKKLPKPKPSRHAAVSSPLANWVIPAVIAVGITLASGAFCAGVGAWVNSRAEVRATLTR